MRYTTWLSLFPLATLACLIPFTAQAQVTPDGTTSTTVNQDGNNFRINQGNRVGDNLFHSFDEFSVPTLGSAVFNNAGDIANIFSRVTGSNISNIDGLIGANGTANLFLINPNGIIFGQNASLNLGGSFFASTADSLLFEGDAEFSAVNPQAPPLLEVSIPIGASFRDNPGDIVNNSNANNGFGLSVSQGENIALIGGEVTLNNGNITAPGGRIELGGLNAPGDVKINKDNSLIFPNNVTRADVSITNNSVVAVSLAEGGAISVNARNLELSNGFLLAGVQNSPTSEAQRANITINATEKLSIEDNEPSFATTILNNGGDITINTGSLEGIGNFNLNSSSFGQQNSGNINITAKDGISLQGTPTTFIGSSANQSTTGNSGNIIITTPSLSLSNISLSAGSNGQGDAGDIQINTTDSISLINSLITASSLGEGNAGNITIESEKGNISFDATGIGAFAVPALGVSGGGRSGDITIKGQSILFTNGANLFADNDGTRDAGNITLEALENIILKGVSQIASNTAGQGNAGNIGIITQSVSIEDGSTINARTFDEGDAGSIFIKATDSISFDNSSGILSNVEPGAIADGGDIKLEANSISFSNSSGLTAIVGGIGNGGDITVNANFLTLDKNSVISTSNIPLQSLQTNLFGGNIALTIADNLILRNNSRITALAGANANGGNVTINADNGFVIAFPNEDNDITANATQGNGGNIDITTQAIFGLEERRSAPPNQTNDIDASSEFGLQGNFSLNTPDVDPTSGLIELPASVGDASDQISQNPCERGIGSQFIITGKGGFPANPHEPLNSDEVRVDLAEPVAAERRGDEATERQGDEGVQGLQPTLVRDEIVPARGWIFNEKGEVTLTAYDPTGNGRQRFQPTKTSCSADPKEN